MKTTREFAPGDRYRYDFKTCTTGKGWAQVDTSQDASYFGTWANPFELKVFNYCEGDLCLQECESVDEFVAELNSIKKWNEDNGHRFFGIDPGFNEALRGKFDEIGCGDLLH